MNTYILSGEHSIWSVGKINGFHQSTNWILFCLAEGWNYIKMAERWTWSIYVILRRHKKKTDAVLILRSSLKHWLQCRNRMATSTFFIFFKFSNCVHGSWFDEGFQIKSDVNVSHAHWKSYTHQPGIISKSVLLSIIFNIFAFFSCKAAKSSFGIPITVICRRPFDR